MKNCGGKVSKVKREGERKKERVSKSASEVSELINKCVLISVNH